MRTLQAGIAEHYGGDYGFALALVAGTVAVAIAILTALGDEAKGVVFGAGGTGPKPNSPPQARPYDIKVTTPVTG